MSLLEPVLVTHVRSVGGWVNAAFHFDHDVIAVNQPDPNVRAWGQDAAWHTAVGADQIGPTQVGVWFSSPLAFPGAWEINGRPLCLNPRPLYIAFPQTGVMTPP